MSGQEKKKILIMDDEAMVGEIACQMLEYLGYEAVWVTNGEDAVEEYSKQREAGQKYAAVIMDLTIPKGMGGQEAVVEILAIDKDAKALVSSGYSTDPIMINYQEYGFVGVIAKPFDLTSIEKALSVF